MPTPRMGQYPEDDAPPPLTDGGNPTAGASGEGQDVKEKDETKTQQYLLNEANSVEHLMTHLPNNPYCAACQRANMKKKHSRRERFRNLKGFIPTKFGEQVTADHFIAAKDESRAVDGSRYGLMVFDIGTMWRDVIPCTYRNE